MKQKFLIVLLAILSVFVCAFGLAACGDDSGNGGDKPIGNGGGDKEQCEHRYTENVEPPTCTERGYTEYVCELCGIRYTDKYTDPAGHKMEGNECSVCHWIDSSIHVHQISMQSGVEATCVNEGRIAYYFCHDCGKLFSDEELTIEITEADTIISKLPHEMDAHVEASEADCYNEGANEHWHCKLCNYNFKDEQGTIFEWQAVIPKKHVNLSEHAIYYKYPTCTEDGNELYYQCEVCEKYFSSTYGTEEVNPADMVLEKLGHDISEEYFVANTFHRYDCTRCDYGEAEAHEFENDVCKKCDYIYHTTAGLRYMTWSGNELYVDGIGEATDTEIIIPEYIMSDDVKQPVTRINENAFLNQTQITSVYIPEGVTVIYDNAFKGCTNLESLYIPSTLLRIGFDAFRGCNSLTKIYITDVVSYGNVNFYDLSEGGPNNHRSTMPFGTYYNLYLNGVLLTDITVQSGAYLPFLGNCQSVKTVDLGNTYVIGTGNFFRCMNLKKVTNLDASVLDSAFYDCNSLEEVEGKVINEVGGNAFYGCYNLKRISLAASVKTIGGVAFGNCRKLEKIDIDDDSQLESVGPGAFSNCNLSALKEDGGAYYFGAKNNPYRFLVDIAYDLKSLTVNPRTEFIADVHSVNLNSIAIPSSVKTIGYNAFRNCYELAEVSVESLTDWLNITFITGGSLNNETSPLSYAEKFIVGGKELDEEVVIPEDITTLKTFALTGFNLKSLTIPDTVTYIEEGALYGITVETLTVPFIGASKIAVNEMAALGYIFGGEYNTPYTLKNLVISEGVITAIRDGAFGVSSIESITFTSAIKSFGAKSVSVYNWESLKEVNFIGTLEEYLQIDFGGYYNPVNLAGTLKINGETVTELVIPETVTHVLTLAFYNKECLTSVVIPETVEVVDDSAFGVNKNLVSIKIAPNVTGKNNFSGCNAVKYLEGPADLINSAVSAATETIIVHNGEFDPSSSYYLSGLKEITIGSGVTAIGEPFTSATKLEKVTAEDIDAWCGIHFGDIRYDGTKGDYKAEHNPVNYTKALYVGDELLTELIVSDSVEFISSYAFVNCEPLTKVILPGDVKIGSYTFRGCVNVTEATVPGSVSGEFANLTELTVIPSTASKSTGYWRCSNLRELIIEEGIEIIDSYDFAGLAELEKVTINGETLKSIGNNAFDGCQKLTELTLPDSLESIGTSAIKNTGITSLRVPEGTKLSSDALSNTKLTEVEVPLTSFAETIDKSYNFWGRSSIDTVTLTGGGEIPDDMFKYAQKLVAVVISASVTSIGSNAFYCCGKLESVTFGEGSELNEIGSNAFYQCTALQSIELPDGFSSVGDYAFYQCRALQSIELPDGVVYIGNSAFDSCLNLTTVSIPDSIKEIQTGAFGGCIRLETTEYDNAVYLGNEDHPCVVLFAAKSTDITQCSISLQAKIIYTNAFNGCSSLTEISIPEGVKQIGDSAFGDCDLTEVIIPEGVELIGKNAFHGCDSLLRVKIPDSVRSVGDSAFYSCANGSRMDITIGSGVTYFGSNVFNYTHVRKVYYTGTIEQWCAIEFTGTLSHPFYYSISSDNPAFYIDNVQVTELVIPETVTVIKNLSFYRFPVTSVRFGANVTTIEKSAFLESKITDIYFTGTEEEWNANGYNLTLAGFEDTVTVHYNAQ